MYYYDYYVVLHKLTTVVYLKSQISTSYNLMLPPIMVIIFWDFLLFYQIFLSPQVKQRGY